MQHLENPPANRRTVAADPGADALLAEIDHRVKNNLQLIASMVLLQQRQTRDEPGRAALKGVLERINAVATVHRRLFQGDPHRFEADAFLRDLAGDLAASAGRDDLRISLDLDAVGMPAASAAPFALCASELLGNALKHGFPDGRGGRIAVTLKADAAGCALGVADDGAGLRGAPAGFGLTLANLMAQQLRAGLEIAPAEPGVRATLTVPLPRDGAA